jgi:hypothetical protein
MADETTKSAEEEARRKTIRKRMSKGKILIEAWNLPDADPFRFRATSRPFEDGEELQVRNLTEVEEKMDEGVYEHGRSGWETFARDMGLVYNWHIIR